MTRNTKTAQENENQQMSLLDLLDQPTARNSDPRTSHKAASLVRTGSMRHAILQVLNESGAFGFATFEIASKMNVPRDYVSPHMKPLECMGLIERTPFTRINPTTKSKAESEVWITTDKYKANYISKIAIPIRRRQCPTCRRPF